VAINYLVWGFSVVFSTGLAATGFSASTARDFSLECDYLILGAAKYVKGGTDA
jgi:hypothetical protein